MCDYTQPKTINLGIISNYFHNLLLLLNEKPVFYRLFNYTGSFVAILIPSYYSDHLIFPLKIEKSVQKPCFRIVFGCFSLKYDAIVLSDCPREKYSRKTYSRKKLEKNTVSSQMIMLPNGLR